MPTINFLDHKTKIDVEPNTKILSAAIKEDIPHRFGCGAAKCGLCAFQVKKKAKLTEMSTTERSLLEELELETDSSIRLACKAKIIEGALELTQDGLD